MRVIGLTGGIGSGKSEAGRRFHDNGIAIVDADAIGHALLEPGGSAVEAVVAAFGSDIVSMGHIDRSRLALSVFGHPDALARLNAIIHPLIAMEIARQCAAHAGAGYEVALIDAALLAEGGRLDSYLQGLVLVLCPEEERIRRVAEQRGMPRDEALRRIHAQTPPEQKEALARWVIHNDGTLAHLHRQVDAIAAALKGA